MNYTQLVQDIQDYLSEDETTFVNQIPSIVRLAEERIYRLVQAQAIEETTTGTLTIASNLLTVPSDFISPLHLVVISGGTSYFLKPKETSWIRASYPATSSDRPRYYALFDQSTIIMAPTPDAAYSYELRYIYKPPSIVTASTTWIGDNAENALLYGCLVEGYRFLKGDKDLMAAYEANFQEAIARLKQVVEGQNRKDFYKNAEPPISSV